MNKPTPRSKAMFNQILNGPKNITNSHIPNIDNSVVPGKRGFIIIINLQY